MSRRKKIVVTLIVLILLFLLVAGALYLLLGSGGKDDSGTKQDNVVKVSIPQPKTGPDGKVIPYIYGVSNDGETAAIYRIYMKTVDGPTVDGAAYEKIVDLPPSFQQKENYGANVLGHYVTQDGSVDYLVFDDADGVAGQAGVDGTVGIVNLKTGEVSTIPTAHGLQTSGGEVVATFLEGQQYSYLYAVAYNTRVLHKIPINSLGKIGVPVTIDLASQGSSSLTLGADFVYTDALKGNGDFGFYTVRNGSILEFDPVQKTIKEAIADAFTHPRIEACEGETMISGRYYLCAPGNKQTIIYVYDLEKKEEGILYDEGEIPISMADLTFGSELTTTGSGKEDLPPLEPGNSSKDTGATSDDADNGQSKRPTVYHTSPASPSSSCAYIYAVSSDSMLYRVDLNDTMTSGDNVLISELPKDFSDGANVLSKHPNGLLYMDDFNAALDCDCGTDGTYASYDPITGDFVVRGEHSPGEDAGSDNNTSGGVIIEDAGEIYWFMTEYGSKNLKRFTLDDDGNITGSRKVFKLGGADDVLLGKDLIFTDALSADGQAHFYTVNNGRLIEFDAVTGGEMTVLNEDFAPIVNNRGESTSCSGLSMVGDNHIACSSRLGTDVEGDVQLYDITTHKLVRLAQTDDIWFTDLAQGRNICENGKGTQAVEPDLSPTQSDVEVYKEAVVIYNIETNNMYADVEYTVTVTNNTTENLALTQVVDVLDDKVIEDWVLPETVVPAGVYENGHITWDTALPTIVPGGSTEFKYTLRIPEEKYGMYFNKVTAYPEGKDPVSADYTVLLQAAIPAPSQPDTGVMDVLRNISTIAIIMFMLALMVARFTQLDEILLLAVSKAARIERARKRFEDGFE